MSTKKIEVTNKALYFIAFLVIIVAFLLLGGGPWARGMMHGSRYMSMGYWNWTQILISLGLGFVLGFLVARRK
jgi:hypothetical protein